MATSLLNYAIHFKEVANYRSFLEQWMRIAGKNGSPLTFGQAALRMGFKSRSFLSDVIQGRKGLTQKSLATLLDGLSTLPPECIRLFENLVYLDHPDLCHTSGGSLVVNTKIKKLKERLRRMAELSVSEVTPIDLIVSPYFHLCYAALGAGSKGESLDRLVQKTQLPKQVVKKVIDDMLVHGFCTELKNSQNTLRDEVHYAAKDSHRIIDALSSDPTFKCFIEQWLTTLLKKINSTLLPKEDLYNVSTFSVRKKDQAVLRQKLTSTIDALIEDYEASEGDAVASLTVVYQVLTGENPL